MKKLVSFLVVLSLFSGAAFAQSLPDGLTISGSGESTLIPLQFQSIDGDIKNFQYNGKDKANSAAFGGVYYGQAGLNIVGDRGTGGFTLQLLGKTNDDTSNIVAINDLAFVWVKPIDFLKIRGGYFLADDLMGKIGGTEFGDYAFRGYGFDENSIFKRYGGDGLGFLLELFPIDGLSIGVALHDRYADGASHYLSTTTPPTDDDLEYNGGWAIGKDKLAENFYEKIQVGVGYAINGIGLVRAQFIGSPSADDVGVTGVADADTFTSKAIQLAFLLGAVGDNPGPVEGLTVDLGAKFSLADSTVKDITITSYHGVSLGAKYTTGALGIQGRVDTKFGATVKLEGDDDPYDGGFILGAELQPSYALDFATVGLTAMFKTVGNSKHKDEIKDGNLHLGFAAWIKKTIGNGFINAALALSVPTASNNYDDDLHKVNTYPLIFSVPVVFGYSF